MSTLSLPDVDGEEKLDRDLTAAEMLWEITWEELERRRRMSPDPTGEKERFCEECRHRVTETMSGGEAGHARGRKEPRCSQFAGYELQTRDGK